jgi:integrase
MTKEAPDLKRYTGVTKDPRSANWLFVKKVPQDLTDHPDYRGKTFACRQSLGTPDLREANALAAALTAELEAKWKAMRAARTTRDPSTLTQAEVQTIAQGLRAAVLAEDEDQRQDLPRLVASLRQWWITKHTRSGTAVSLGAHALTMDAQALRDALMAAGQTTDPGPSLPWLLTEDGASELAQWPAWKGLPPPVRDVLVMRNQEALDRAREAASRGDASPFLVVADRVAMGLGINLGPDGWLSPAAHGLRLTCQDAFLIALEERVQRDQGRHIQTPQTVSLEVQQTAQATTQQTTQPGPVVVAAGPVAAKTKPKRDKRKPVDILEADPSQVYLRDVLEDWKRKGNAQGRGHPVKTVSKYTKAVDRFEALTDNPSMADLKRTDGPKFARAMQALEGADAMTADSIRLTLRICGTMLNHYSSLTGHIEADLWAKVGKQVRGDGNKAPAKKAARDEWKPDELARLFGLDVWQHYNVPDSTNAGLDAAYWVPVLGLFTGARVSELAQLLVDDLEERSGVWFLRFAVTREGQSLKAAASHRTIPLPQKLIDLGLIDYRDAIKTAGQVWLFPALTKDSQNGAGGGVSKWFSALKKSQGFRDELDFHSFRGLVNTQLIRLGFPEEMRSLYVGHKPEGGVNVINYNKLKPEDLIPLAQRLDFPFLDLPKVYTRPAWFPGWQPKRRKTTA